MRWKFVFPTTPPIKDRRNDTSRCLVGLSDVVQLLGTYLGNNCFANQLYRQVWWRLFRFMNVFSKRVDRQSFVVLTDNDTVSFRY